MEKRHVKRLNVAGKNLNTHAENINGLKQFSSAVLQGCWSGSYCYVHLNVTVPCVMITHIHIQRHTLLHE